MKILQILLIILFCAPPLYAEQALVLTEIEKIQENIWYLQKDLAAQKAALTKEQEQLAALDSGSEKGRLELNQRITSLAKLVASHQEMANQAESHLGRLADNVSALSGDLGTQRDMIVEQAGKITALQSSLQGLRDEFSANQADTRQAHAEALAQLEETRAQLDDTRTQMETLGQDVGGRVEQIGLWGAGAVLVLAIILTLVLALRKSDAKKSATSQKNPPKHEM